MTQRRIIRRSLAEQIAEHSKGSPSEAGGRRVYVPTGATVLNLALSDSTEGGFGVGKVVNVIGDHSSGKTFLSLSVFAEAHRRAEFDGYKLVFDDAEQANEFNLPRLLGEGCAKRIAAPAYDREAGAVHSHTIQDFQYHVQMHLNAGKPFIYVLDSFDALTSEEELDRADKKHKARAAGKEIAGTYGMEKAKHSSEILRIVTAGISKTASLLLIISQTRENIDPMSFQRRTRSGGKALGFYASYELWTAVDRKIKLTAEGRERVVGVSCKCKVTKNKMTGKLREVKFPIYYSYGIDDIGACIDFLVEEGWWNKEPSGKITSTGIGCQSAQRAKLIAYIEDNDTYAELRRMCDEAWEWIEKSMELKRKPRYE